MADFKVGDRVRAKAAIYEPADDHAPGGYVCGKGDLLIVRRVRDTGKWPLSVSHEDVTDNSFSCGPDEVVPDGVTAAQPVAWMHVQGNHFEPSLRELDDEEKARGWTQFPLYGTPGVKGGGA